MILHNIPHNNTKQNKNETKENPTYIQQSVNIMFHQLFTYIDAASLGVDEEHRLEIVQAFLDLDYEEEVATINVQSEIAEN